VRPALHKVTVPSGLKTKAASRLLLKSLFVDFVTICQIGMSSQVEMQVYEQPCFGELQPSLSPPLTAPLPAWTALVHAKF
jgi:hypothetical protein